MPGFIDTHHHQAWTAIRSSIPDSILIDDGTGTPSAQQNYFGNVLSTFAPVYRPQDVYVSELFGGLAQLDAGVTTVHGRLARSTTRPQHSDAAVQALRDAGRRAVARLLRRSAGGVAGNARYPRRRPPPARATGSPPTTGLAHHGHGRRDLPARLRGGLGNRARARNPDRRAHRRHLRHARRVRRYRWAAGKAGQRFGPTIFSST